MRFKIVALLGLLLTANLIGCSGAASIPNPPSEAKEGPPPGTSDVWNKKAKK